MALAPAPDTPHTTPLDHDVCYRAVESRDVRFDGVFFVAVLTTRVYCRPSCPVRRPRSRNVRFYRSGAAAQQAGFRACRRCLPDAVPGSPEWNARADVVARAVRLVDDGVVDREGVGGLARRLGYSPRQLRRTMVAELGVGPQLLARARRTSTARTLLESTDEPVAQVAFAAGFTSIRQFNETMRQVFGLTPSDVRARARRRAGALPTHGEVLDLRLPYRAPLPLGELLDFLAARCVPGVEQVERGVYSRVLRLPRGLGVVSLGPAVSDARRPHVACRLRLDDARDITAAVQRCRRLLDLEADPQAVDAAFARDPLLGPLAAARPGRRLPGSVDGDELAARAVLGQQVSVAAARRLAGNLAALCGERLTHPAGGLSVAFPTAEAIAAADLTPVGLTGARRATLQGLARALAAGDVRLDVGADRAEAEQALLRLPGIGPWTAAYVRMRALGDPDVFLGTDLGVRKALDRLSAAGAPVPAAGAGTVAGGAGTVADERWRPWRSYAVQHLWASLASAPATVRNAASARRPA